MANIKSAKKRIGVIDKKTARNKRVKNHIKALLKSFDAAIAEGDMAAAKEYLVLAEKKLDQSVAKGINHKNTAARKVSRLNKRFNKANA
ncbi:MAG: 30S ribosomal protein S20 [Anaerovoracaceae bacterium]